MVDKLMAQMAYHRTSYSKQETFMMRKKLQFHLQVINSPIMILRELVLRNMGVNVLVDIVVGTKAIPQEVVLPLATPPKMLKTKNPERLHVKRQLTPLGKVSLLVIIVVHSATNKDPKELGEEYSKLTFSVAFAQALLCYLLPLSISRVAKIFIRKCCLLSLCLICCKCFLVHSALLGWFGGLPAAKALRR